MTNGNLVLKSCMFLTFIAVTIIMGCVDSAPETVNVDVYINDRIMEPNKIVLKQDDTLVISLFSDESGSIHIHGYDIRQKIDEGEIRKLELDTYATGTYKITFHVEGKDHSHQDHSNHENSSDDHETKIEEVGIGSLIVNPR